MIRLSKSCIDKNEEIAVNRVLKDGFLGMGSDVQSFENQLSHMFKREVVCVANGTAALHLALQACGIGSGDEVLVPTITYIASFQAISASGATAIACDISKETLLLDIRDAEKKITKKTKLLMLVHYAGDPGNLDRYYTFARNHNLRIIEDAAHAFGTTYKKRLIGSFGDVTCFSFDGIKNITSGEGGCVISNDVDVIKKVKNARLLGVESDTEKRYKNDRTWKLSVKYQGWRYHMSNIMAAIGIEQLKKFDVFSAKRKHIALKYDNIFAQSKLIKSFERDYNNVVPHIYAVKILKMQNRDFVIKEMKKKGIQVGFHYQPNHTLEFFEQDNASLLKSEEIFPHILSLPMHPEVSDPDIDTIANELIKIVQNLE
tara:strand:- start:1072 stop:2190 length:1119 start_codon:yes stop_codon:yes gene_type:complete